jgi:hypothetical protein
MRNKILDYIKTSIYPIRLFEISKELEFDIQIVKECVTQLENESLIFKHSNRGYLSTPERVKEVEQPNTSTSKESAPIKQDRPVKAVKPKQTRPTVIYPPKPKKKYKATPERLQQMKEYRLRNPTTRKLLYGENEQNKIAKRPVSDISYYGDVMASDDTVYFKSVNRMSIRQGSYTCMKIADLERLLTIAKELQK